MFRNKIVITSLEEDLQNIGLLPRNQKQLNEWIEEEENDSKKPADDSDEDEMNHDSEDEAEGHEDAESHEDADMDQHDDEDQHDDDIEDKDDDHMPEKPMSHLKMGEMMEEGDEEDGKPETQAQYDKRMAKENFEKYRGMSREEMKMLKERDPEKFYEVMNKSYERRNVVSDMMRPKYGMPRRPPTSYDESNNSMSKVNSLLEEVQSLVNSVNTTQKNESLKSFANISIISEMLSRGFVKLSKILDEQDLRGVAHTFRSLSETSGKVALHLKSNKPLRNIEESFKSHMNTLIKGLDLYEDIVEACSSEKEDEDGEESEEHSDSDGDVHVDIIKNGSHDFHKKPNLK